MPKPRPAKRSKKESDDESSSSSSDSGPEDRNPAPKKDSKKEPASSSRKTPASSNEGYNCEPMKNDSGDSYWELTRNRRVTIREFKGKTLIDIREYYEKDGKHLPGKKGVSLSAGEWNKLKELAADVDKVIEKM